MCAHAHASTAHPPRPGYVYYTRVKRLHASAALISTIHHRTPEKKSNNIARTATFTRVCVREIAKSPVPRDDSQMYAPTRSSRGDLFASSIRGIRGEVREEDDQGEMKGARGKLRRINACFIVRRFIGEPLTIVAALYWRNDVYEATSCSRSRLIGPVQRYRRNPAAFATRLASASMVDSPRMNSDERCICTDIIIPRAG